MYDPQQEDIWGTAIRIAESVGTHSYCDPSDTRTRERLSQREAGFREARQLIVDALRSAQRESIARRYPLVK